MNYMQTFNKILVLRKYQPYFYCHIFKYASAILTPLFIFFKISANFVTLSRFAIGIASLIGIAFFHNNYFSALLFCYWIMSSILDFVDGDIARVQNKSTFVGNYLDGLLDLILAALLYLFLGYVMYDVENNIIYTWIGSIGCILTLVSNLNIDRYSAFRRWIMEEQQLDIGKHLMLSPFDFIRSSYNNLRPALIIILFCVGYNHILLLILLLLGLFWNFIYLLYYVILFTMNAKSISDRPRHDGTGRPR